MPRTYPTTKAADFTKHPFGRLTVLRDGPRLPNGNKQWECLCACGNILIARLANIKNGNTRSCGCWKRDRQFKHGHATVKNTSSEYTSWESMKIRIRRDLVYVRQGICICKAWHDFAVFINDMGLKPTPRHTIDRIDGTLHYSCGRCVECLEKGWLMNCRWATYAEQNRNHTRNRNFTVDGVTLCLTDWAKRLQLHPRTLISRLETWPTQKALTTPNLRGTYSLLGKWQPNNSYSIFP